MNKNFDYKQLLLVILIGLVIGVAITKISDEKKVIAQIQLPNFRMSDGVNFTVSPEELVGELSSDEFLDVVEDKTKITNLKQSLLPISMGGDGKLESSIPRSKGYVSVAVTARSYDDGALVLNTILHMLNSQLDPLKIENEREYKLLSDEYESILGVGERVSSKIPIKNNLSILVDDLRESRSSNLRQIVIAKLISLRLDKVRNNKLGKYHFNGGVKKLSSSPIALFIEILSGVLFALAVYYRKAILRLVK